MPVFRSGPGLAPPWCEVESFDVVHVRPGESYLFNRSAKRERLFVGRGDCQIVSPAGMTRAIEGTSVELSTEPGRLEVLRVFSETVLVRVCGRWGETTGGCGVFQLDNSVLPRNSGDPTGYPRTTDFDNHYHDCDEYWIIFEGRCVAVSEQKLYVIGEGDCLATGMGYHHDLPQVIAPVRAIYFETTLEGRKRPGHLWDHTHGPASPASDRI